MSDYEDYMEEVLDSLKEQEPLDLDEEDVLDTDWDE